VTGIKIAIQKGGAIGKEAESVCGKPLSPEIIDFCTTIFRKGGAILSGPGSGRFVYDLRKQFDLFCKMTPLVPFPVLRNAGMIRARATRNVNMLLVRENVSGIYQGDWKEKINENERRTAVHSFHYEDQEVLRILDVAARLADARKGKMTCVIKEGGIPSISRLWRDCATEVAAHNRIECTFLNVDLAAYLMIQNPLQFDVIVTSNLFGDILSDIGTVLLGSRALSYSGNFSGDSAAVYQTNHGCAFDLADKNQANPVGQILSLAMLLRESFGLVAEADLIRKAIVHVWKQGWRTSDLSGTGVRVAGTSEFGNLIADSIVMNATKVANEPA
jgi:3-isopropylmalate dehydrogenase